MAKDWFAQKKRNQFSDRENVGGNYCSNLREKQTDRTVQPVTHQQTVCPITISAPPLSAVEKIVATSTQNIM